MLYIIASFKKEISYLLDIVEIIDKKRLGGKIYYRCKLDGNEFYIVKSGLGKKSIQVNNEQFKNCDFIISTGFCGALTKDVENGEVIISKRIITSDEDGYGLIIKGKGINEKNIHYDNIDFDQALIERLITRLADDNINARIVKSFTSPKIVRNKVQRSNLNKITDAEVVDMEDIFRFDFAKRIGAGFLSIRVVLDEIVDDIPGFIDGFKMGQRVTGILSKMNKAAQCIAIAMEKFVGLMGK